MEAYGGEESFSREEVVALPVVYASQKDQTSLNLSSLSNNLADSMVLTFLTLACKSAMDSAVVDFQNDDIRQRHPVKMWEARVEAVPDTVSPLLEDPISE